MRRDSGQERERDSSVKNGRRVSALGRVAEVVERESALGDDRAHVFVADELLVRGGPRARDF